MKITEINTIENYSNYSYNYWTKILDLGYLIYRPTPNKIVIQDADSFEIVKEYEIASKQSFGQSAFDDKIYITKQNELYELKLDNLSLELLYKSQEQYVGITHSSHSSYPVLYYEGTYKRKPRTIRYNLIDPETNRSIYYSEEKVYLVSHFEDKGIFYERDSDKWQQYDLKTKSKLWEIEIGDRISGRRWYEFNSNNFLIETHIRNENVAHLQNRKTHNGELIWQIENCLSHYHKIIDTENFIGIGGSKLHLFNSNGENEYVELNVDCSVSSHLSTVDNNDLIFCSHIGSNIPVIGIVNINNNEIDSVFEIDVSKDKSFRIGLDVPHKIKNKIYVRDSLNKMRIFKIG